MNTPARRPRVCVVGSSIIDLVSYAPRLPKTGETVPGSRFDTGFGGKGANQAAMAALLGADVHMVSKVGADTFGDDYLGNFATLGIDATHVGRSSTASTGVAPIWVDERTGANSIIVVLGANEEITVADVVAATPAINAADVMVCQWEIPIDAVIAALEIARRSGVRTIFNPAPARGVLPDEIWPLIDIFCPNETETEQLSEQTVGSLAEASAAAQLFLRRGVRTVVLTLGERGALIVDESRTTHLDAPTVQAVDTTGAGDAFVGSLATMLAAGRSIDDAVARANADASDSVQRHGTQKSYADHRAAPPWGDPKAE